MPTGVTGSGAATLGMEELETVAGAKSKTRKRRAKRVGRETAVRCEACSGHVGFGGVRMEEVGRGEEWVEVKFGVEAICDDCVNNFDFCTQCGGGGAFRTGKWRPRGLFDHGRRTCSLPHKRIGDMPNFQITTFRCPFERLEDESGNLINFTFDPQPVIEKRDDHVMARLQASFVDGRFPGNLELLRLKRKEIMALYRINGFINIATAQHMTDNPHLSTWHKLVKRLDTGGKELDMLTLGGFVHLDTAESAYPVSPFDVQRYVATSDALRVSKPTRRRGKNQEDDVDEVELLLAGFQFVSWHTRHRHVCILHSMVVMKAQLDDPGSQCNSLLLGTLARINRDADQQGLLRPLHLWCMLYKSYFESGATIVSEFQKFGFLMLPEYCARWGIEIGKMKETMDSFMFQKEHAETMVIVVMRWEDVRWDGWEGVR